MPKKSLATIICIAYKQENIFLGKQDFITDNKSGIINLSPSTQKEIDEDLKRYDNYATENNIKVDLEYMAIFEKEKKRQEVLRNEFYFIKILIDYVYPCTGYYLS